MKYEQMTRGEREVVRKAIVILSEPLEDNLEREFDIYMRYVEKLWGLDEGDIVLLDNVMNINNTDPVNDEASHNRFLLGRIRYFLDNPDRSFEFKRVVR